MPVDDQDPAYRLVDPDTGDIVGTVYGTGSGDLAVQNESGTETLFTDDGIETPALETDSVNAGKAAVDDADLPIGSADEVADDREFDTTYQNTSGRLLSVNIVAQTNSADDSIRLAGLVDSSSSLGFFDEQHRVDLPDYPTSDVRMSVKLLVPEGDYYEARTIDGNDADIFRWFEREWVR